MAAIRLLAALGALYLPALVLTARLMRGSPDRAIWAGTIGLASCLFLSVGLAHVHLTLFFAVWGVALAASVIGAARSWRASRTVVAGLPMAEPEGRSAGVDRWLVLVLVLVAVSRLVVALPHELPPGWDPTFHLVLARKVLETRHMVFDWSPFEDVDLNYPAGSHVLVAVLAGATRLELHTVFNLLIPVLGVLTVAQMYVLARHATASREVARYTAVAYGFWANWGSLDYYRWGGMPNLIGMSMLVGVLTLLVMPDFGRRRRWLAGLLVASIMLTHHHTMMTAGVLLLVLLVYYALRRDRERLSGMLESLGIAALLSSFYLVPYALKASGIGETSVLTSEPAIPANRLVESFGAVLLPFGLLGMFLTWRSRSSHRPAALVGVAAGTLAALFVAFHYVYPAIALRWAGERYVPFTPSRFLTDLVYPVSIFAGFAVYRLRAATRLPPAAAITAMLLLGLTLYPAWRHLYTIPAISAPMWEAYTWIQDNTEPDAIVLDRGRWSVYGTWRRTAATSLPVSEPSTRGTAKQRLIAALEAAADADGPNGTANRPPEAGETQILAIRQGSIAGDRERILWRHASGLAVVEIWPRR